MKGTENIGSIDPESKPIVVNLAGTNSYAVVTLTDNKVPEYHVVDMDQNGYGTATALGEVTQTDIAMTSHTGTPPVYGWHYTGYEDHVNNKVIVYGTRYEDNPVNPDQGTTEIVAFEMNSNTSVPPQVSEVYSIDGCGPTKMGELQISPQGDKLLWYNHGKKVAAFDHREAEIYAIELTPDKTGNTGVVDIISTNPAGNYKEGRAEFMANGEDVLYSQRGVYEAPSTGSEKNVWKYEKLTTQISPVNPANTYLFSEIRRGKDNNYYMPAMGEKINQLQSYDGTAITSVQFDSEYQMASSLPTQVYKLYASGSTVPDEYKREINSRYYELKDHLGNVRVVIGDTKIGTDENGDNTIDGSDNVAFKPTVESFSDYYPFGFEARSLNSNQYRFGFNGMESDDEVSGVGNSYTAEFWQYDSRLGRRWNIDPKYKEWISNYATFGNNPIIFVDPKGDDWFVHQESKNLLYVKDASEIDEERYGKGWNRIGGDEFFGDKVMLDDENILNRYEYEIGPTKTKPFLKERGFTLAEKQEVQISEYSIKHAEKPGMVIEQEGKRKSISKRETTVIKEEELGKVWDVRESKAKWGKEYSKTTKYKRYAKGEDTSSSSSYDSNAGENLMKDIATFIVETFLTKSKK